MKSMIKIKLILILALFYGVAYGQLFVNNGSNINARYGVHVYIGGTFQNQNNGNANIEAFAGTPAEIFITGNLVNNAFISADGHIRLLGDWINNNTFNAGIGTVFMEGGNQLLSGTSVTQFHNLTLQGTGVKTQTIDKQCNGILNLTDRELATQTHGFYVLNTDPNAVQRITGFVSSLNGGFLSRNTNSNSNYLFPVGSTIGVFRYRPVEIEPANNAANTYTVRLANVDASIESYDINSHTSEVCQINPNFYHQINRTSGGTAADITIFYDQAADGNWDGIANWEAAPFNEWQEISTSFTVADVPMYRAVVNNWNDFSDIPYALYKSSVIITFNDFGPFCLGTPNFTLPTTSNEGIPGTWTPAFVNTSVLGTQTYTFTPNPPLVCATPYSIDIEVIDCCNVSITANATNPQCYGNNGTITFSAVNGQAPFTFTVNGNPATSPYSAPAGTYTVQVTDALGCTDNTVVTITSPSQLNVSYSFNPILCYGDNTTVLVTASGGEPPYTGAGAFQVSAGNYNYVVTDNNGCAESVNVNITQPAQLQVTLTTAPAQCGNTGGSIFSSVSGGTGNYYYIWSNGNTSEFISNINPGAYTLTVSDENSCSLSVSTNVGISGFLSPTITQISPITCYGYSNGALQVNVANTVNPVSYYWNNGINSPFNNNLASGIYNVTVTDGWGCQGTSSFDLQDPQPIIISETLNHPSCNGNPDGSISLSISGGTLPYSFMWNTGSTSSSINNLSSGSYQVTVSDANNCIASKTFILQQPDLISLEYVAHNVSCAGYKDGAIYLNAIGGTAPFNFGIIYDNYTLSGQNHNNLSTGTYTAIVTDINGCSDQKTISISEPYPLSASVTVSNPTCIGISNGEIEVTVIGGTAPYYFTYNQNVVDFHVLTGLPEGVYNVTITDANDCKYEIKAISLTDYQVDCIVIPNAFTPNEDGINDTWIIENIELFPSAYIYVYNRWGQELWVGRPGENWNGTYKDKLVPTGPYLYVINLYNGTKPYVGIVTVIY
ncbi:MAG: gliding motility-associated C-terminal domain-containing protein [Bacteroidales bacterium]